MNPDKNNVESKDPEDSKASGGDKTRNEDQKTEEQEADITAENSRSKHKITIEKGKKPIDFDDLFF